MKKLRIVILSLSVFSLFCSLFFNLSYIIYDSTNKLNNSLIKLIEMPISSNIFTFVIMSAIIIIWYIYHRKDRAESITNGLVLLMYLVYLTFAIVDAIKLYELPLRSANDELSMLAYDFSMAIFVAPATWIVISIIPVLLHFIASVCTGGYDNVSEPDNIYGFMFTIIGFCYLITMLFVGFATKTPVFTRIYALNENGLIMTVTILTFILCAGFRFNHVVLDVFNIFMHLLFIIVWFIILIHNKYSATQTYLAMYHFIMIIPLFVLSFFVLNHFVKIDRFYKGSTKNFLNE